MHRLYTPEAQAETKRFLDKLDTERRQTMKARSMAWYIGVMFGLPPYGHSGDIDKIYEDVERYIAAELAND